MTIINFMPLGLLVRLKVERVVLMKHSFNRLTAEAPPPAISLFQVEGLRVLSRPRLSSAGLGLLKTIVTDARTTFDTDGLLF
ncbi:hypothetical protein EVAR_73508_1 [Eumeta japonica]|uniref:Uncharacterized protein n=1 Tax=Eumeta variegata TaxID=151549 RepID=A0A4C1TDL5_EUMVA|nr:hypothetical protein EVAR_73508_1 [Eumeta japonica]